MTDVNEWIDRIQTLLDVQKDLSLDLIQTQFTRRELIELMIMLNVVRDVEKR